MNQSSGSCYSREPFKKQGMRSIFCFGWRDCIFMSPCIFRSVRTVIELQRKFGPVIDFMWHLLSWTNDTTTRVKILNHNFLSVNGVTLCSACGQNSDFEGPCNGTHTIAGMVGKTVCKKCGRTTNEFETPCIENHDISPLMGKLMCRKCGTSGITSVFQKKKCNSNHSISVIDGTAKCRRCGATKDWTTKRCGL